MALHRLLRVLLICAVSYCGASEENDGHNYRTRRQLPNNIFKSINGEQCLGNDRSTGGVCLTSNQCNAQGGKIIGSCGLLATCCSLNTCDVSTNSKEAVFSNPPLNSESAGRECSYNVEINNNNVCQMRIDFEIFNLAPPTAVGPAENVAQGPVYTCRNDLFQVTSLQTNSDILPPLCGANSGQHMYVRVNALNNRVIRINFKIADRSSQPNLPQATWKIKVTQLECLSLNTLGLLEALPVSPSSSSAARDEYLIAPPGCLQYYPDRSGAFQSFNYNGGAGPYIASLSYATCFKRSSNDNGIKLTAGSFELAFHLDENLLVSTNCQLDLINLESLSEDTLNFPKAETADGLGAAKCAQIVTLTAPGGLTVNFHSDYLFLDNVLKSNYRFNYFITSK